MKFLIASIAFLFFHSISIAQREAWKLFVRVPFERDLQKAEIPFSWGTEIRKTEVTNFGLDMLLNYRIRGFEVYLGVGYFRDRFNIKRGYDHQALNIGRDSIPLGTATKNYTYSLVRFPIGLQFQPLKFKKLLIGVGTEYFFNFRFRRIYNGRLPFSGANNVYKGVDFFGNSLHLLVNVSKPIHNIHLLKVEPFIQICNSYKKDRFLMEKENEKVTGNFDAYGIAVSYSLKL